MAQKFTNFEVGRRVRHPIHGDGVVISLDFNRELIVCDYLDAKGWINTAQQIELIPQPITLPPCVHPDDNKVTITVEDNQQKSARHNQGKTQLREIDPDFILGIGEVLTKSRAKYDAFNWQKDTPFSVPYESLLRHLMAFQKGEELDKETACHHLLHAATNIMFLYYHRNNVKMDDRGFKEKK